ncbi:MAG TPA: hypothetical protein VJS91_06255 [Nitrososphaeraceae archaeon]|nr:hypothetical protein [Nitrososphaeraceae archaeon]
MFSASSLYFLVAIFGESIESDETHISQPVEGQEEVVNESGRNESEVALETHNETSETPQQLLQEEQALAKNASESNQIEREQVDGTQNQEMYEKQLRILELPLSVGAGIGYAATGLWMILDKKNSKSPYIIAIVGSLILLGVYASSRTIGISNLGIVSVGILDSVVAGLQVAIVATCLYILMTRIYPDGITVDK